jgi:TetR/AcrR family transcriptional repressor of bet genes
MPKRVDIEAQRRAIASAAIGIIDAAGLDGARLRDVARAAHVTTGAVTHYFDGKDAVLEAALEEVAQRTLQRLEAGRHRRSSDSATFVAQVGAYLPLDEPSRREWRVWLAFWGQAIADDRLRAIHRRYYKAFVDHVADALRLLAPRLSPREARAGADAVVAALDGVGTRATLEPEGWPPKRQRQTLAALLTPLLAAFTKP